MADAVNVLVLNNSPHHYVVQLQNQSDGTGEAAVIKVDKSTLTGPDGTEPSKLKLEKIKGNVNGMQVRLLWDHDTDDELMTLGPGDYNLDFRDVGGLKDPASAGGTGDVLLTTNGHSAGDSYDITLYFRKKD